MENETNPLRETSITETYIAKETPTLWKWYFGWHPRILFSLPIFLLFVYNGIWFIGAEIADVIYFFQTKPVSWGAIFLIIFFGAILFWLFIAPIYISFRSVGWIYEINIGNNTAWKKFLCSIGIVLLVVFGTSIIRIISIWILGI